MTRFAAPSRHDSDPHLLDGRITVAKLLKGLAASPWALSFGSFAVTALIIHSNGLMLV